MAMRYRGNDPIIDRFCGLIAPEMGQIDQIHLFGSRCRDDWRPDSDYDILVVLPTKDRVIISRLYDAVMDILLETGKLVSLKVFSRSEFLRLASIPTPFMEKVMDEGVRIG
jgi:predicted nucleotidyltransferase